MAILAGAMLLLASSAASAHPVKNAPVKAVSVNAALRPIGVRILPGSRINLVSHDSKMPIAITNDFDTEVRVLLHVRPRTLVVTMPEIVSVTIPAQTTINAKVPISATADGSVTIDAWLSTFSGQKFGKPVELSVSVSEDVELFILLSFGGVVALLLVIGVLRTLKRRGLKDEVTA
jgi:hypothetical protein